MINRIRLKLGLSALLGNIQQIDNKKLKILPCQYQDETRFDDEQDEVEDEIIRIIWQYTTDNNLKILKISQSSKS